MVSKNMNDFVANITEFSDQKKSQSTELADPGREGLGRQQKYSFVKSKVNAVIYFRIGVWL